MSGFQVAVVDLPARRLAGMKVQTSMSKAQNDCPALWSEFGPRIEGLMAAGCGRGGSYGVSSMINPEDFHYWAAVERGTLASTPDDLEELEIPAGKYASCRVQGLAKLGEAYMFLYQTWPQSQKEYAFSVEAPCFELYPPDFKCSDSFEVFMPLKKI